jgi:cytochrome P450
LCHSQLLEIENMDAITAKPLRVTGPAALLWGRRFASDPLIATRRMFEQCGAFVILAEAIPFTRRAHAPMLGIPVVFTAGAAFNGEVFSDPEVWRGVSVLPGGPKNSAAWRMIWGLPRLTGERHAHYRKLIGQPLRRISIEALGERMARIADEETASWPVGERINLWERVRQMMQRFSVELLFGGGEQAHAIAELAGRVTEHKWARSAVALPINLPFTARRRIVREADVLERRILRWVAEKRGRADERDLAAIVINSPDENGKPADDATIVAHIASLFALSSEGSQSVLTWTMILLAQHPKIAAMLAEELLEKVGGAPLPLAKAAKLAALDRVVKESMRLLPPVPLQIRVAQADTCIAGNHFPKRTRVILNTFLTNRMPDLYPEPESFRPERWSAIAPNSFEFPAFGAGPHICPGHWFGTAAVKVALAAILSRFRVEIPPGTRIDYRAQPTLRPRQRVDVLLHPAAGGNAPAPSPLTGTLRDLSNWSK